MQSISRPSKVQLFRNRYEVAQMPKLKLSIHGSTTAGLVTLYINIQYILIPINKILDIS